MIHEARRSALTGVDRSLYAVWIQRQPCDSAPALIKIGLILCDFSAISVQDWYQLAVIPSQIRSWLGAWIRRAQRRQAPTEPEIQPRYDSTQVVRLRRWPRGSCKVLVGGSIKGRCAISHCINTETRVAGETLYRNVG